MKTLFRLAALMLLLVGVCLSQGTPATLGNVGVLLDQNFSTGSVATAGIPVTSGDFNGYNYYKVEFTPLSGSNLTTCAVYVDSTLDNRTWSQGGAISGQTCTSEGSATNGPVAANSVRINIVVAGQGQVRVRLLGAMSSLAGGGGGGTVASVGLALPAGLFSVSGSPVTGSGTLTATFQTIAAHLVLGNNTSSPTVAALVQLGFSDLTGAATVSQLPFTYTTLNSATKLVTAGTFSGSAGAGVCLDANQNLTTAACPSASQTWPTAAGIMVYAGGSVFGTSLTAPAGAIVGTTDAQTLTGKSIAGSEINSGTVGASFLPAALSSSTSINGLNIGATTGTFSLAAGKTFTVSNALTLAGTDSTTQTFPSTSGTVVTSVTTAGGDLSGTFPSPTVAKVNALAIPVSAALVGTNSSSQFIANTGTIANNTSGTAAGLAATPTTTGFSNGCLQVASNVMSSTGLACGSGGGVPYPSGTGIVVVTTGTSWGTTLTAPTGSIVGAGQANTYTTGLQSFASATMSLPSSAAYAPTTAALFGYDSTNNRAVLGNGTSTSILPWITAAPTTLHLAEFNGILGLMDDSAIATANVVTQTSNGAANQIATYSTTNKVLVPATTLPTAAFPALSGDAQTIAGSLAVNVSRLNGTLFTGTLNDLVAFGTGGNIPLDTGVLYTNLTTQTSNGAANQVCTYTGANKTCVPGTVANAALANSTIGINGTSNQITSSSSTPALGGSTTLAIANPFTWPGKFTTVAGGTGAASFNIPSGVAPTSAVSGDVWNASGIVKFYDGTNTNSFVTIQSAVTSGHCPQFSGTAGLLVDSGTACPNISGLAATQVVVASSSSALTSYATFTADSLGNVTASSFSVGGSNLNAGETLLAQPTGSGGAAPTGTNAIGLAAPTSVPTSYNAVFPSAGSSGYFKVSSSVSQTGCTASATNLCGFWESTIDLTADVGATILPGANGGTGSAFTAFTGPTSSLKTFTLPNASAVILTSNAAVTVGQGGIGINTLNNHGPLVGAGTAPVTALAAGATNAPMIGQGSSTDPIFSSILYPSSATSGGLIYMSSASQMSSSGAYSAGNILVGGGTGNPPNGATGLTWTSPQLTIGTEGTTTGTLRLASSTATGGVIISPAAAASDFTATLPANTGTVAELNLAQSFTVLQTFSATGAASTPGLTVSGAPYAVGTATTNFPQVYLNAGAAVTSFSTAGTAFGINAPSAFAGNLMDFHVNGGASVAKLDASGNLTIASCTGCGSVSLAFPLTVSGTTTSGGLPYFSSTTVLTSSALLTSNSIMLGGGAGAAPKTAAGFTTDGTSVLTLGVAGTSTASIVLSSSTATGSVTLTPASAASAFTVTIPAATSTIVLASTSTTTTQALFATGTAGVGGYRAIAAGDLPATPMATPGTAVTISLPHGYGICTGTCTVTLPAPTAAGDDFCLWNDVAVATAITISGQTGVFFSKTDMSAYGTTGGTFTATAVAGNRVCMVARDTTHWIPISFVGAWTAN